MKRILFTIFILNAFFTFGQTGFFGKLNAIDFQYNLAPTFGRKYIVVEEGNSNSVDEKRRIINSSYTFKYSRIITNKFSLALGIDIASMKSQLGSISNYTSYYDPQDDLWKSEYNKWRFVQPKMKYKGVTLEFNFFGKYGINPLGMHGGFSFDFGKIVADYSNLAVYSKVHSEYNYGFVEVDTFAYMDFETSSEMLESVKSNVFNFRFHLGKNVILNRNLLLKFDFTYSLLTAVFNSEVGFYSGDIVTNFLSGGGLFYRPDEEYSIYETGSIAEQEVYTYRRTIAGYKKMVFNVGLSYAF